MQVGFARFCYYAGVNCGWLSAMKYKQAGWTVDGQWVGDGLDGR